MAEHFDELTKALASGVSRRDALKRFVGGIFGGLLAAVGLTKTAGAQAAGTCPAYCRSLGITPGNGNAFGKCVSNCSNCRLAGGTECGASGCCSGGAVCADPATGTCGCANPGSCGNLHSCEGDLSCVCFETVESVGFCHRPESCGGLQACSSSADCPADHPACVVTCCGAQAVCIRPCTAAADAIAVTGAGTTVG